MEFLVVQIFDSWGGMLSPEDYQEFSWKYINQIVEALAPEAHVVVFCERLLVCFQNWQRNDEI